MIRPKEIDIKLKKMLNKERYQHSWQVSKLAEKIAIFYRIPPKKAKVIGLLHDCAKDYSFRELENLMKKYHIKINTIEKNIPGIWHAFVGAELARKIFEIQDIDMLNAIKWHSTSSENPSLLEKILYIADKTEPGREMKYIERARKLIWRDINQTMLELLNGEIKHLVSRKMIIHPNTVMARNTLLINKQKEEIE